MAIGATVGKGGVNDLADVIVVQHLLNGWLLATGQPRLSTDGGCGPKTIDAITAFQSRVVKLSKPDGLISPGGRTWTALAGAQPTPTPAPAPTPTPAPRPAPTPTPAPRPAPTPTPPPSDLSGAAWWHANQARYPNSASLNDLVSPFREQAIAFVDALREAGAKVIVSATRRNRTRAHLMHYSWRVSRGEIAPKDVPALAGLPIRWDHGDLASSRKGAKEMVDLFAIAYQPSLTSNHIEGRAVDMTISWTGTLTIKDKTGKSHKLASPRSGNTNPDLHKIGASYGVLKLLSDPPHWSDNGH